MQRWDRDGGAAAEGQVGGRDEVGEAGGEAVTVALQDQRLGDVGDLEADVLEQPVVGNGDAVDGLHVDAIEGGEEGVLDVQCLGRADVGGEAELVEIGEGLKVEVADVRELREAERGEDLAVVDGEVTANLLQAVGAHGCEVGGVLDDEVAGDCLYAGNVDGVAGARGNGQASGEGRARCQSRRIAGVLNGGGCRDGARGGCGGQDASVQAQQFDGLPR